MRKEKNGPARRERAWNNSVSCHTRPEYTQKGLLLRGISTREKKDRGTSLRKTRIRTNKGGFTTKGKESIWREGRPVSADCICYFREGEGGGAGIGGKGLGGGGARAETG